MRKHKIIDTIFFYDEIEMLYFRLSELDEYVDEFIIMECEMDFKGNPKPLNYLKNINLCDFWLSSKIIAETNGKILSFFITEFNCHQDDKN